MNIRSLQEFVVLSRHLKLSSAAQELYISPSTLSEHISSLEKDLGVALFDRKGGLKLTIAGEKALAIVQAMLGEYEQLRSLRLSAEKSDAITWRVPNYYMGLKELMRAKPRFLEKYPDCEVRFETNEFQTANPFSILKEKKSDVSLLYLCQGESIEEQLKPGFSYARIGGFKSAFMANAEHPLSNKETVSLKDLEGAKIVYALCPTGSIFADSLQAHLSARGVSVRVAGLHVNRDSDVFLNDLNGRLVSWVAGRPVPPIYEDLGLRELRTDFDLNTDAYLLYRPEDLSELHLSYFEVLRELEEEGAF